jgi:hypothetical protein
MRTWDAPDFSRPIAAPLHRCAELLGVDLATGRAAAANVELYIRADGTKVWGASCSWSGNYGPSRSTVDGTRPPTRERCSRRSVTFGTTIRIARLHHPSCLNWRVGDLRFLCTVGDCW